MRLDVLLRKTWTKSFVCIYILLCHAEDCKRETMSSIILSIYTFLGIQLPPFIFECSHFEYNTSSVMPMSTWQRILFVETQWIRTFCQRWVWKRQCERTSQQTRGKENARHREVNTQSQLRKRSWWKLVYFYVYTYIYFRRIGKTIAMLKMKYDNGNRNKICVFVCVVVIIVFHLAGKQSV